MTNLEPNTNSKPNTDEGPATSQETLVERIRRLMAERGFNQTTLAAKVGMDRTELNRTLGGKRQPRPQELSWIAQAFGISIDELLKEVDLPVALRKTRDELEELTRRVLDAEAERDRSRLELKALDSERGGERARWQQGRAELVSETARLRTECERQVAQLRRDGETRERALASALRTEQEASRKAKEDLANANLLADRNYRAAKALEAQLAGTQQQIAQERSQKVATGVLVGLAGMLLGGAMGSSQGEAEDEDEDEDS
jgi:transcriptional regulator with XRE-family HTH domain